MRRKTAEETRRHVLGVATGLFYRNGVRAVGMDQIIKAAEVGNATVYRQFPTKDDLAAAYVQECADAWFARMRAVSDPVDDPAGKLHAVFRETAEGVARPAYRGCPMLNTHAEFPADDHPAHIVATVHKRQVRDWFRDLAAAASARDPEMLADQLLIVLNGVLATASVLGPDGTATVGETIARQLIATSVSR